MQLYFALCKEVATLKKMFGASILEWAIEEFTRHAFSDKISHNKSLTNWGMINFVWKILSCPAERMLQKYY